jgi:hypothetical protein
MLLRHTALKTALLATTADVTRYALNAVHVRPDGVVEATDGHILVRCTDTAPMDPADFPTVPSAASPLQPAEKGILISTDHVKKLLGTMPKRATIPCLQTVNVGTIDAKPYAVATDLDTPLVIALERTNDGATFPTTDRVMIKDGDRAVIRVTLSAAMLQTLARIGKEVGTSKTPTVTLEIPTEAEYHATHPNGTHGVTSGIRFTAGDGEVHADGVVMPCRL